MGFNFDSGFHSKYHSLNVTLFIGDQHLSYYIDFVRSCGFMLKVFWQWCNPLTLQPERSSGVCSIPGRITPLERDDKGLRTRLALSYVRDHCAWR